MSGTSRKATVRSAAFCDHPVRAVGCGVEVLAPELLHVGPAAAELVRERKLFRAGHQLTVARVLAAVSGLLNDPESTPVETKTVAKPSCHQVISRWRGMDYRRHEKKRKRERNMEGGGEKER